MGRFPPNVRRAEGSPDKSLPLHDGDAWRFANG
jgi:hypothetical protein